MSGIQFKMRYKLIHKLEKMGATSKDRALTCEEARFGVKETWWIDYFAGEFLGKIKKTKNHRYYVT